ncbi:alpha/beta hydrolase [Conexibacter woesei]|uniref:Alpha/beta hydrolase fold-3 domain protein n=1 Tax=Conexibacter woesei (strain DSM 14684 / CCUG 47730 / CIP 108061 / JCM 11494 / NBRC 100937 / ID131577) TaxID=469383 RepID=D3F3Q9_CONWI|nr:alpha/beta hydrolase [Conexibacter woesei]ADB52424.1 Alpha/beta hydrolase fold-3 domain protein [Conexibacter woesei DSM 14684]
MPSEAHEQLVQLILDNPTPADASLADLRAGFDGFLSAQPVPGEVEVEHVDAGGVPVELVGMPGATDDRIVFYLHGGGIAMGSAAGYRAFAARLSAETGARVAVVDYRLAPEAPYPAPQDDAIAAYGWLQQQGRAGDRVLFAADSGGAGFMLSVVARIRDLAIALPAGMVAMCPWIDLALGDTIAAAEDVGDPVSTVEGLRYFAGLYLQGHSPVDPVVNVLHGDLRGLPPLLVLAGTRDIGYRDGLRVAELARKVEVPVEVRTGHGLIHNYQLAAHLPEAAEAVAALGEFFDQRVPVKVSAIEERER